MRVRRDTGGGEKERGSLNAHAAKFKQRTVRKRPLRKAGAAVEHPIGMSLWVQDALACLPGAWAHGLQQGLVRTPRLRGEEDVTVLGEIWRHLGLEAERRPTVAGRQRRQRFVPGPRPQCAQQAVKL